MVDELITLQGNFFKAPLIKDELRQHVVTVSLLIARQLHFVFSRPENMGIHEQAQAQLLGMTNTTGMNDPDVQPRGEGLDLSYEHLSNTVFALVMEELYEFAYLGMLYGTGYEMNSESAPSWVSRILVDLSRSQYVEESEQYAPAKDAILALVAVCETAQARMILEEIQRDDTFMSWYGFEGHEGLTIRQVALLSGMSEASLRTMANPKRSNPLKTQSHGRHTYIPTSDAKEWLISKGRYVPLSDIDRRGVEVDLASEAFVDLDHLSQRLESRLHFLLGTDDAGDVTAEMAALRGGLIGKRQFEDGPCLNLKTDDYGNTALMAKIGKALHLPPELLSLKAAHLHAQAMANAFERRFSETVRQTRKKS